MQNIAELRNGASRLIYLIAAFQQSATRGLAVAESLHTWLNTPHRDILFTEEELSQIEAAQKLLATAQERMENIVMPDIQDKCQSL